MQYITQRIDKEEIYVGSDTACGGRSRKHAARYLFLLFFSVRVKITHLRTYYHRSLRYRNPSRCPRRPLLLLGRTTARAVSHYG